MRGNAQARVLLRFAVDELSWVGGAIVPGGRKPGEGIPGAGHVSAVPCISLRIAGGGETRQVGTRPAGIRHSPHKPCTLLYLQRLLDFAAAVYLADLAASVTDR